MQVYNITEKKIYTLPCKIGAFYVSKPKPNKGIYEVYGDLDPDKKVLSWKIEDNKAVPNLVIEKTKILTKEKVLNPWLDDYSPIDFIFKVQATKASLRGSLKDLKDKLVGEVPAKVTKDSIIGYVTYLEISDGFVLDPKTKEVSHPLPDIEVTQSHNYLIEENGIIKNDPSETNPFNNIEIDW